MKVAEKQTIEITLCRDELTYMIKDLLLCPLRWTRQTMNSKIILNLPEEFKDEIQKEVFEFLKVRVRKEKVNEKKSI